MAVNAQSPTAAKIVCKPSISCRPLPIVFLPAFALFCVQSSYYRGAAGALLVYDVTRRRTFENVKMWLDKSRSHGHPDIVIILVGNKSDLISERQVGYEEGNEFARQNGLLFIETSAKQIKNIDLVLTFF